ncbi:hypothetical protein H072_7833 [Dactylellina haptotyla CBS 200.50]|uniref:Uncharacterized protein n=1 Tax=Dactylellina haptotyla (strain CBS 200.50) TaxID=1284197 RepID=S8BT93_DACHA|nr:hypothetical protein H072_7833 [Dactylellina haptotyla CBS 200.50]
MLFIKSLVLAFGFMAGVSSTAIVPAPVDQESSVEKRGDGPYAWCRYYQDGGFWKVGFHFRFETWGQWDDDWGQGFLDNIRGHCGANVENWGFWYDQGPPPTWGHADFWIYAYPYGNYNLPQCTLDAVWQASEKWGAITGAYCTKQYDNWS